MNKNFVSAIIPAYNEEKKIGHVLKALTVSKYLDEIIVVNDGSTDNTLKLIKQYGNCVLVNLNKNFGKGYAIVQGIKKAQGDIVVFFDADLTGLKDKHIHRLIAALKNRKKDGVIAYPDYLKTDKLFLPLSGERSYFKKDLLPYLKIMAKKGYGLELYLNYVFRNKKVSLFKMDGVKCPLKYEKQSYDTVAKQFLIESFDILSEILNQENPISYLMKSYLYAFYIKKPKKRNHQADKLIEYIKTNIIYKIIK